MRRLIAFWMFSLVVVAVLTAVAVRAQVDKTPPRIMSGNDLGFRVEGIDRRTGKPTGVLVIRVDGQWVEIGAGSSPLPVSAR